MSGKKLTRKDRNQKIQGSKVVKEDKSHLMTEEEKVDQAVDESFPASDPPGY